MLPNHHITKPVFIGEIRADGQFNVVSPDDPKKAKLVPGDAWSDYLPGLQGSGSADWVTLKCGNYNTGHQEVPGFGLLIAWST